MNFASGRYLYLLPLLLLLALGLSLWSAKVYRQRLALLSRQFLQRSESLIGLRRLLILLSLAAIILALARPRWDFHWTEVKHRGSDIIVVLDLSQSMLATDVKPNRLEKAKRAIRDLLGAVQGDRIGLVLFSGDAFIQCPLTFDKGSFDLFLDAATIDLLPHQGTEIAGALDLAERAFEQGSEVGTHAKTVILISDGEDHGDNALVRAQTLGEKGVKVYSLGMGTEGSPIPTANGSFLRDKRGQLILSKPDLPGLAKIAEATGGRLIQGNENLDDFYRKELSHGSELQSTREKVWVERHVMLSALALCLLCLEYFLSQRRVA